MLEFSTAQAADDKSCLAEATVGQPKRSFLYNAVRVIIKVSPVNGATQRYVPAVSWPRVQHLYFYSLMEGHYGDRQMYDSTRRNFYWSQMTNDVYATVRDCHSCARNCLTTKQKCKLRLFSPNKPLEFVAIKIFGPFPNTKTGNQLIVIVTDWFSKLRKATVRTKNESNHSCCCLHQWLGGELWNTIDSLTGRSPWFTS